MKQILTLTDFSEIAENAVESAFIFANKYNAELTIYHNSSDSELIMYELNDKPCVDQLILANPFLNPPITMWKHLSKKHNVNARYMVGSANFIEKIYAITELLKIDLIVMGSSGAGGKNEYIWGSNTEKVVKQVDIPVLVIKRPITDYRIDNIVFASSFDTAEKDVLMFALDLLKPTEDAVIHLLCINTTSFFSQPSSLMKSAMRDFEVLVHPLKAKSHFYPDYSVDAGIRHFLEEVNPDILIMSNKNAKPVKRFLAGSNTIRAINHSDYPVLSIDFKEDKKG